MKSVSVESASQQQTGGQSKQRKASYEDPDVVKSGYLYIKRPPCHPWLRLKVPFFLFLIKQNVYSFNLI